MNNYYVKVMKGMLKFGVNSYTQLPTITNELVSQW